ncbi:double-strand break repair helicase AddA [Thermohalobaculum xanthum]|uniref:double-strand break repair helicase AddA n=1 Tax=Thermohalobaculum xanthum TaxID=2753746 RepID=UPI001F2924D2|nr:double-strand break repair helicase AddA [Thermohalobaculum xanthum]
MSVGPTLAQRQAADPMVSAWVGANAGSGKTRVLTQRVARLLLAGARPERILCLTYTRAAAAEMQNRLFGMLGGWAMAPDTELGADLAALEGAAQPITDPARLARARTLFAAALETPGGLRIQTIHAFCDALLRRFPLEAGISPRFEVLDDRQKALMTDAILAELAAEAESAGGGPFDRIAARLNEGGITALTEAVLARREDFPAVPVGPRIAAHLGEDAALGPEAAARTALDALDWDALGAHADLQRRVGRATGARVAEAIETALTLRATDPTDAAGALLGAYLKQDGEPRSRHNFPVSAVLAADPGAGELTDEMLAWAAGAADAMRRAEAAARAADLDAFARAFLERYDAAKAARGLLDFDDLVGRARDLVARSDLAAWTLYKLDRGIDHILVDEAQDTAPAQWDVIRAVTQEFFSGEDEGRARSLFVVGDEKQSIYSFQGAEPRAFGSTRDELAAWLDAMGRSLARPALTTSFRSAPGILDFVDAVFAGEAAEGLTVDGTSVEHSAHRAGDAARIDLWPLVEPAGAEDDGEWWRPVDQPPPGAPKLRLARMLATEIARMLASDSLPPRANRPARRVRPGDILVLVARRDLLARALIRQLKALGVPVAGADRLTLAGELAVKDLMALIRVSITPDDDLALAALLRSPVFGMSEDALFDLAHGRARGQGLRDRLRAAGPPEVVAVLDDLAARADFLRPYEFLQRALIRHGARTRLIARLGAEAEDPIDELLEQALAFEARETPSLAGFVAWVEAGEIQVKREMDAAAGEVRVMTVHGAKGLEAPVVILPDTMARPNRGGGRPRLFTLGEAPSGGNAPAAPLVAWAGATAGEPEAVRAAADRAAAREADERRRLLYVALTRAEDWLILCGAGDPARAEDTWHGLIEAGAERLGGWTEVAGPAGLEGPIRRRESGPEASTAIPGETCAPDADAQHSAAQPPDPRPLPDWLGPAAAEARPAAPLAPSGLAPDSPEAPAGGAGRGRDVALDYGTAVHLLLERLAGHDARARAELAGPLLAQALPDLDPALAEGARAEAEAVLAAPFAARLFGAGTLAEVAIAARLPDGRELSGRIDRLVVTATEVLAVDFKTDPAPPATPDGVRAEYLVQLGAYRTALARIYPGRAVSAAILWTAAARLMPLPDGVVDAAFAAALADQPA